MPVEGLSFVWKIHLFCEIRGEIAGETCHVGSGDLAMISGVRLGARDDGCFPILNEELIGTLSNPQNHTVAWDGEGVE